MYEYIYVVCITSGIDQMYTYIDVSNGLLGRGFLH
jgi:hypothetical protein